MAFPANAQLERLLSSGARRIILAEIDYAYESGGAPATGTLYFSDATYGTGQSDSPPNQSYVAAILKTPGYRRELDPHTFRARSSIGNLVIDNADGGSDDLLRRAVDGQEIRFYLGGEGWARSAFALVLTAIVETVSATELEVTVTLRPKLLSLDVAVQGEAVGGAGQNATRTVPLLWGSFENLDVTPYLYDAAGLIYRVVSNYGAGSFVGAVRDNGLTLRTDPGWGTVTGANTTVNAGTDTFTHVAHNLAVNDVIFFWVAPNLDAYWAPFPGMSARPYWVITVPTADTFTLSATKGGATLDITGTTFSNPTTPSTILNLARQRWFDDTINTGCIQLSSTPAARVTVDLRNVADSQAPFALAKSLMETYGNVTAADIDTAAFTAADVALDAKVQFPGYTTVAVMERANLADVIDALVGSAFGWVADDGNGLITCGLLDVSGIAGATATRALSSAAMLQPGLTCENLRVRYGEATVLHGRILTVQTDLSVLVDTFYRGRWGQEYVFAEYSTAPSGTTYALNKPLYHKTMTSAAPQRSPHTKWRYQTGTLNDSSGSLSGYADEIVADVAPHLKLLTCRTGLENFAWQVGDIVNLTYPRFNLDGGQKCKVISVGVDLLEGVVDIVMLTQMAPDLT